MTCLGSWHSRGSSLVWLASLALIVAGFLNSPQCAAAQESSPQVRLDASKVGPRTVEPLTERAILRDYQAACSSMAQALESSELGPLDGPFAGDAKQVLTETVLSQQKSRLRQRYLNQGHQLQAVFYAPEGDVIELHDTAEYHRQVLDDGKTIEDAHVVVHYVVLMTPSADRWVVRHLQAVDKF